MFLPNFARFDSPRTGRPAQTQVPAGAVADEELIDGYGDHQRRVAEMASAPQANSRFLIRQLAGEFAARASSLEPIRQLEFIGHSDLVRTAKGRNLADEQTVSEARAVDVRTEFFQALFLDPDNRVTPVEVAEAIRRGRLAVLTLGLGARQPLRVSASAAVPENRRVEIRLLLRQSLRI